MDYFWHSKTMWHIAISHIIWENAKRRRRYNSFHWERRKIQNLKANYPDRHTDYNNVTTQGWRSRRRNWTLGIKHIQSFSYHILTHTHTHKNYIPLITSKSNTLKWQLKAWRHWQNMMLETFHANVLFYNDQMNVILVSKEAQVQSSVSVISPGFVNLLLCCNKFSPTF